MKVKMCIYLSNRDASGLTSSSVLITYISVPTARFQSIYSHQCFSFVIPVTVKSLSLAIFDAQATC